MVSLLPAGNKRPSMRTAVALIHGLEKLLTYNRRLVCSVLPWWWANGRRRM